MVHLGGLVVAAVRDEQGDFLADPALLLLDQLLQVLGHGGDKGVVLVIEGYADAQAVVLLLPARAGGEKEEQQ